ncbi:MAG: hypothetical protein WCT14_11000 [Treponemataceae bacterium]
MGLKGFVDLQVNGYKGTDFSSPELTADAIRKTVGAIADRGTAAFCPTVITSSWAAYEHVLPLLADAVSDPACEGRILGIHLEGPFISPEDGAVGAHPRDLVIPPSVEDFDRLYGLCRGTLRLITVAPEREGAIGLIRRAVEQGVRVSLGHTLAAEEDVRKAMEAGACLCTHLGNGCPNKMDRHRNPVWAQLGSPLSIMIIADGHHLPLSVINAFLMAKAPDKAILTSDTAPVGGLPPGVYPAFGGQVRITETGRIESGDHLAGSSACLIDCVNHLTASGYSDESLLWRLARDNPLAVLGIDDRTLRIPDSPNVYWDGVEFAVNIRKL